jgi:putative MATE family efflux protein
VKPQPSLTEGSILAAVMRLAWPMVVANVLQNAFNVVDMIFVGRLGAEAIAAVALSGVLMQITWTLLVGLSIGTTAIVARSIGAGETETAGRAAAQSLALGVVVSILLAGFAFAAGRGALRLLGAADMVLDLADGYLLINFACSFTVVIFFMSTGIMKGAGDAMTPMVLLGIATVVNIVLDPIMIFGLLGFPALGVNGAAWATVIAQGLSMVGALWAMGRGSSRVRVSWRSFRPDRDLIRRILRISGPGTLQGVVQNAASLILMRVVSAFGVVVMAAYGIGLRIDLIVMMPGWAFGATASTLVGQNLGAGHAGRAGRSAWVATGLYAAFMLVAGSLFLALADPVIRVFNGDPAVVALGASYLRIRVASYLFLAPALVIASAFNGAGDAVTPMVMRALGLLVVQIPAAILLPRLWGAGAVGVWVAIALASLVQGGGLAASFATGRWKRARV